MMRIAVVLLLAALVWSGLNLIRLERYHYAAFLGMCAKDEPDRLEVDRCLVAAEPRTNGLWDLAYGLRVL